MSQLLKVLEDLNDPSKQYQITLTSILDSSLPELEVIVSSIEISSLKDYARILISYFKKDVVELRRIVENLNDTKDKFCSLEEFELIKRLSELRLAIRNGEVKWEYIHRLKSLTRLINPSLLSLWEGEIYIVIGFALSEINQLRKSSYYYKKSINGFEAIGAYKKQIRAIHNFAATISCLDKTKYVLKEYLFVYRQAYKFQAFDYAALALANLAHEYQNLGLMRLADKYSKKAILLVENNQNSLQYYLVLLQRAHILIDLGKISFAQDLLDRCQNSPFSEIQGGLLIMNSIIKQTPLFKDNQFENIIVLPGWKERYKLSMKRKKKEIKPTFLEEKLIFLLSIRNRTMHEIIFKLYGSKIELEHTKNRFFVMLNRIDKKFPHLIQRYKSNIYSIE